MKNFIPILQHSQLFSGMSDDEIISMTKCLNAKVKAYKKGEHIYHVGERVSDITVLASGRLHIQRSDFWGNSNIISGIEAGEMFGEAYVTPNSGVILNNVIASSDSTVIFFSARKIITTCPTACPHHTKVVQNLFFAISDKNRRLVQKLGHMSNRSIREKLMSYLSEESGRQNSSTIFIPFNRQELADFLSVDRSAMSNELSKMQRDGLLEYEKNRFTLYLQRENTQI